VKPTKIGFFFPQSNIIKEVQQPDNQPYYCTSSCNFAQHAEALNHGLQILHMKWSITLFNGFLHENVKSSLSAQRK
jgi:hypothetical protein